MNLHNEETEICSVLGEMISENHNSSGYVVVNEMLCQVVGAIASLVYSKLVLIFTYKRDGGKLTEDGFFPCSYSLLQDNLGISRRAQDTAIESLVKVGLIKSENKLCTATNSMIRHIAVNPDVSVVDKLIIDAYNTKYHTNLPYRVNKGE